MKNKREHQCSNCGKRIKGHSKLLLCKRCQGGSLRLAAECLAKIEVQH